MTTNAKHAFSPREPVMPQSALHLARRMDWNAVPVSVWRGGRSAASSAATSVRDAAPGMGMTACVLAEQEFQQKLAKVQDFPWSVATADDEVCSIRVARILLVHTQGTWGTIGVSLDFKRLPVQGQWHSGPALRLAPVQGQGLRGCFVLLSPCRSA